MPLLDSLLGWMQDPRRTQQMQGLGGSIQGGLLNILDKDKEYQAMMQRAFGNPNNPVQVTDPESLAQLTDMTMAGPMAFAPAGVIKMAGGNWINNSVENALSNLKSEVGPTLEQIQYVESRRGTVAAEEFRKNLLEQYAPDVAINNWVDKQLTRYVKNQMATPDDPVRALAEKDATHLPQGTPMPRNMSEVFARREAAGFPAAQGTSREAQVWEALADKPISSRTAGESINRGKGEPWMEKVDPFTTVYSADATNLGRTSAFQDLGFDHLVDELRNSTNPASGLPRELMIRPESLQQLSMPQAVERVAKINKWRAEQKVQADLVTANNAATQTVKEYPDQGMKWVELRQPKAVLEEGHTLGPLRDPDMHGIIDQRTGQIVSVGATPEEALGLYKRKERYKYLEDALKYEGDQMRHCVGGYCPSVADGRTRIISLRDAKGEPHVTIELETQRIQDFTANTLDPSDPTRTLRDRIRIEKGGQGFEEYGSKLLKELGIEPPQKIAQIKGKANEKPNDKYLPFVQDYVKSGKWSGIDDLQNAELYSAKDVVTFMPENFTMSRNARQLAIGRARAVGELPEYMTKPEYEAMLLKHAPEDIWAAEKAKLAAEDDELLRQLRPPAGLAGAIPFLATDEEQRKSLMQSLGY